jgi:hypothetical protein
MTIAPDLELAVTPPGSLAPSVSAAYTLSGE